MKQKKHGVSVIIIVSMPFLLGWQKINLQDCQEFKKQGILESRQKSNSASEIPIAFSNLTPYKIIEKATSSLYKAKTMQIRMETFLEHPSFHLKTYLNSDVQNVDNHKTAGRISFSLLVPNGFSTSQWVQTYQIRGLPFTWNPIKREWQEEELKISGKDMDKVLGYSILSSLFTIDEGSIDPASIHLLGLEKRKGKDCFVLKYEVAAHMFKGWGLTGNISIKTWIDTKEFLPQALRAEGKIADMYILQVVDYANFHCPLELSLPSFISEKVQKEKERLKNESESLAKIVSQIRGWDKVEQINMEFKDRIFIREFLNRQIDEDFSPECLNNEGFLLKWLGLLNKDADYKESLINSQAAQIAGLYDPRNKMILLGDWIHPLFVEAILVHEIVHAYQDKNPGIDKFLQNKDRNESLDLISARQSVIEGEATAVMLEYLLRKDQKSLKESPDIFALIEEKLLKQSRYVKENMLYNIYGYGTQFIQAYLKKYSWAELNNIYKLPPASMKEIIHPHLYRDNENADTKGWLEALENSVPGEWRKIYRNRLGEFIIFLSLRQTLDRKTSEKAASGWQKDEAGIYENKDGHRLVFFLSRWDSQMDALEFLEAYKEGLKKRYPGIDLKEEQGHIFLETEEKEMFSCWSENDLVKVIWAKGLNKGEFEALAGKANSKLGIQSEL